MSVFKTRFYYCTSKVGDTLLGIMESAPYEGIQSTCSLYSHDGSFVLNAYNFNRPIMYILYEARACIKAISLDALGVTK